MADDFIPVTGQTGTDQAPVGVTLQNLSSLLSGGNTSSTSQQPVGAALQTLSSTSQQPAQTTAAAPDDLSKAPIYQVRATHYGYEQPGQEGYDPKSAKGIGAWDNQLSGGTSVALSPDMEQSLGVKPNDQLVFTGSDGTQRNLVFHDRTNQDLRGRIDIYDPNNQIGDLGQGTISKVGASGPVIPALETSNKQVQKLPNSFGMRVANADDVKKFDTYIQSGGDISKIPVYDRLAVAIAKDPNFLQKDENFDTFYDLVYKPMQKQSAGDQFNQAVMNLPATMGGFFNNLGQSIQNTVQGSADAAQLAFLKATGQTTDTNYQDVMKRFAREQATMSQGTGHAISDAWDFVTNLYNGALQLTHPLADLFTTDQQKVDIDRAYARGIRDTAAVQQGVAQLGNVFQSTSAQAYKLVGEYADVGNQIQQATPNEAAVQGYATVENPLNYLPVGKALEAVDAIKPIFFERGLQAAEDVAVSSAKKGVLDSTQILPKSPELDAAQPTYSATRNLQVELAPQAAQAAQDLTDKTNILNQHITTLGQISGDPGTVTAIASNLLAPGGNVLQKAGAAAEWISDVPEMIGNRFASGNPMAKQVITRTLDKIIFGTALEHLGPVGAVATEAIEHLPQIADSLSNLAKVSGKELGYGQTSIPYWTRVAQQTKLMPKFMASFLDSPAVQIATAVGKGGAAGLATGAGMGLVSGGIPGMVSGGALGLIQGMAGGGFGQWMKFQDPNQYFLQARGDWKRYRDTLSPPDQANFGKLSATNQVILAQHAQQFPGLGVDYINDPTPNAPKGMHFTDEAGRSNIQVNLAYPDSVIRGTLAHEIQHATVYGGTLPDVYTTLLGDPKSGAIGQYTLLGSDGKPVGVDPTTNRYITNPEFNALKNDYTNALAKSGKPISQLTDLDIAREINAEHGVDYLLSGGGMLDSASAYRPGLLSKNAFKTALAKMGYTFDESGQMIGAPNGQIGGTELMRDLAKNPDLMSLAKSYWGTTWREGKIDAEEVPTTRFRKRDMQNPNVADSWLTNASEIQRNQDGTVMRDANTGLPIYRTPKQVEEYNLNFTRAIGKGLDSLTDDERAAIGYRKQGDNIFVRYLPDKVIDPIAATNEYNPYQIAALRRTSSVLGDAGSPGMEMRFFYHTALTENKRYSGFEGTEKIAVPYGIELTKNKNINFKCVDFNQLTANYMKMRNRPVFQKLWATPDEFTQDAHTYFTNHSEGRPGADGLGIQKRDAINALLNLDVNQQREANPLVEQMPKGVRPIIKSYRLDRANQITPTGTIRPFVSEEQYRKMAANYLPGGPIEPERVDQVAVMRNGKVWTGLSHPDAYESMLNGEKSVKVSPAPHFDDPKEVYMGFLTNHGNFLDRQDAYALAHDQPFPSASAKRYSEGLQGVDLTGYLPSESVEDVAARMKR